MTNPDQRGQPSKTPGGAGNASTPASWEKSDASVSGSKRVTSWAEVHFKLLEGIAPPSVIVDGNYDILHLSEGAGRYLKFAGGEATTNILRLVHPVLRTNLRAALSQAAETRSIVGLENMPVEIRNELRLAKLFVRPAPGIAGTCFLIVFESSETVLDEVKQTQIIAEGQALRQIESELEEAKAQLQSTVVQYEVSNEELQTMNEELRSSNEELENSREELQVIIGELNVLNQQLKNNIMDLSRANSDLQNLMASTEVATVFLDRQLCVTRYTFGAAPLFNLIPGDIGRPFSHLHHRLDYESIISDAELVLRHLGRVEREARSKGRSFLIRISPYRTLEDQIDGVVLTAVDITELESTQSALRESEEQLRLILENAREFAIFSMDEERRVIKWNIGAERLLGYIEKEIIGQSADIIFTPDDFASGVPDQEAHVALTKGRAVDERWHVRKDGSYLWGSGYMMTMQGADGTEVGFLKILHDRTAGKQAEEALEASRQQLWQALQEAEQARAAAEAAGRAKDRFLAMLSHELRTPLTPVLTATEWLLRREKLSPRVAEGLLMIQRNVELEARFIDDLLDITRISRGKLELTQQPLHLHDIIQTAVEISQPDIQAKDQRLTVDLKAGQDRINGDQRRLQQVFWNLLKNASKFTPQGGEIQVASENQGEYVAVRIIDTGVGIDPSVIPYIFEEFQQGGDHISRQFGGLGLGLTIAKATVEGHGGHIAASSAGHDRGATLTVKLPLLPEES